MPPASPTSIDFRGRSFRLDKRFDIGNSSRVRTPEQTLDTVRPVFTRFGLTRLGNVTGLDRVGLPVTIAIRPNSYSLVQSSGKGTDLASALASAAMESIELACAEHLQQPQYRQTYRAMASRTPIPDVEQLPLSPHSLFSVDRPEDWVLAWDLVNQEDLAIPAHAVTTDFRELNGPLCPASFSMDSNGLASGNHFLEAMLAGLLEVVERDGVACHSEAARFGHSKRSVALTGLSDPKIEWVAALLDRAGLHPVVYDCTTEVGVPTFEAAVFDPASNLVGTAKGYGAHLNPSTAILRALTEAVQARVLIISGSRDDMYRDGYRAMRIRHRLIVEHYRRSEAASEGVRHADASTPTFESDIAHIIEGLKRAGLGRVAVIDLTPPDCPVVVVRVVVPGLEGYHHPGYRPRARARRFVREICGDVIPDTDPTTVGRDFSVAPGPAGGVL